ncbi:MAG TPA: glycosyltransferase [Thermoleophilaceae bacterium]|jgi:glycosyltransferase involved in cell wall biosynthesis|nr:glycosyltransferase [Thermoleophilaceae bacterium]
MRVLQLNTSDHGGGAQAIAYSLHRAYALRGHDSAIAVGTKRGSDPDVYEIPRSGTLQRARSRYGSTLRGHEDFDFPGTAHLLDLPPWTPDVVHAHNLHAGYFDLRMLPGIARQRPLLLTLHDQWLYTGHCAHPLGHERWREGCGNCPNLGVYPALLRDGTAWNLRRKASIYEGMRVRVATPSRWLMERVHDSVLASAVVESRVIPNGVDLQIFSPGDRAEARRAIGLPVDSPVVMFAANQTRTNPFKDYPTIARAAEILGARGRELTLACVGDPGPDRQLGAVLLRHFANQGEPPALVPFYRAADLYLHAARADTFPNTVLESLACGTPVVATAVGGIPEQVDDGETGLLAPLGDAAALADAVERLLDDSGRRQAMANRAAAVARERYGLDAMVDPYEAWLEELADSRT